MNDDTPHDALFRHVFGRPEDGLGLLRMVLPEELAERLDPGTLEAHSGSFIDPQLAHREADLLFSVRMRGGGGNSGGSGDDRDDSGKPQEIQRRRGRSGGQGEEKRLLVYVLFEHQSRVDRMMPFRMLRYVVRVQERALGGRSRSGPLPAVLPVVVYHGPRPWNGPTCLRELVDLPREIGAEAERLLPSFRFRLLDLSLCPDEQIEHSPLSPRGRLALLLLKHTRQARDMLALLERWSRLVEALYGGESGSDALQPFLLYILTVRTELDFDQVAGTIERGLGHRARETAMTTIRQLIDQGVQKGIQEGIEKGMQKGARRTARDVLVRLLRRRFGAPTASQLARIDRSNLDQINRWIDRILEAESVEQVLKG